MRAYVAANTGPHGSLSKIHCWGVPDPAEATGNEAEIRLAFADALRMLTNRIEIFVSLPLHSLDQLTLRRRLDAIGKTQDANAKPASAA